MLALLVDKNRNHGGSILEDNRLQQLAVKTQEILDKMGKGKAIVSGDHVAIMVDARFSPRSALCLAISLLAVGGSADDFELIT